MQANNKMVPVAVLLPVFFKDNPVFLKKSIVSILNQSYKHYHLIILIDGPISIALQEVINKFLDKSNIIKINYKKNRGLAKVLNEGIRYCIENKYRYIVRMDADDICHKDRFLHQVSFMDQHNEAMIVGSNSLLINSEDKIIGKKKVKRRANFRDMVKRCEAIHPSIMFRNEFFKNERLYYNESLMKSQDYDLWLRFTKNSGIIYNLQDYLLSFRYEENIIFRRKREQIINIRLKFKYASFISALFYSINNLLILLSPSFVIKWYLKLKQV